MAFTFIQGTDPTAWAPRLVQKGSALRLGASGLLAKTLTGPVTLTHRGPSLRRSGCCVPLQSGVERLTVASALTLCPAPGARHPPGTPT
jgi:hypothetical protein